MNPCGFYSVFIIADIDFFDIQKKPGVIAPRLDFQLAAYTVRIHDPAGFN
jgi:hypothetical protein